MDDLSKLHTYVKVMYDRAVQQIEKHFVHDFGARPQRGTYKKDYEEGDGETDTNMDLHNFGDDENWLGSLVGGQLDDLDYGSSEATEALEALDVGGRHLGS